MTILRMEPEQHKREFWKFALSFVIIIFGAIILLAFWRSYQIENGRKKVDQLAVSIEDAKKRDYEAAMADTYGGKTPQETLSLYIAAVEKGDYELASKYFIEANQEKELESFDGASPSSTVKYASELHKALSQNGLYSDDQKYFSMYKPILIQMELYPNGIWKIIEI